MLEAVVAGVIAGLLSPLLLLWVQHNWIWRGQKTIELRNAIFDEAISALSQYATDALDPRIQLQKVQYRGAERRVELRPETQRLMEKSRGMVRAFFSAGASAAFDTALRTSIGIDDIPNQAFDKARNDAILSLAKELGLR